MNGSAKNRVSDRLGVFGREREREGDRERRETMYNEN
jgi:hypothetical protein